MSLALAGLLWVALGADAPDLATPEARRDAMLARQLAEPYPPTGLWHTEDFALAAYHLNQRTAEADAALAQMATTKVADGDFAKPNEFHWHAYLLERLVFLFGAASRHYPGRMSAAAEDAIHGLLWAWAAPACRLEMTLPERDWWVWGSENHHAQAWASFWGAAHLFAAHPAYRDRRYADGTTPAAMAQAFDGWCKRFAFERAAKGLLVEANSDYNKYTLGGWYNLADFAADPELRRRFDLLLNLYWADWAIEQLAGVRGGSRHRCYPGTGSTAGSAADGIPWYHFGLGTARSRHPAHMCAATTLWRPDPVVLDLARGVGRDEPYTAASRRPGRARARAADAAVPNYATDPAHPYFSQVGAYDLDPDLPGIHRVTYVTPDYVVGTSQVPALTAKDWTNISSQNRWEGVIFGGHPTARIFVQPLKPARGSVYNACWSVQSKGILIVQRLKGSNAQGLRVWFDQSLRRAERDGWVFAAAPRAYAAVRVVTGGTAWEPDSVEQHHEGKGATDQGEWLALRDAFSPVILECARASDHPSFEAFQAAVLANPLTWVDQRLTYQSRPQQTTLTLQADYTRPPEVDGEAVDYAPQRVYDSPFIQSAYGSGVVTLRCGERTRVLDFRDPPA